MAQFQHNPETGEVRVFDNKAGAWREATPNEVRAAQKPGGATAQGFASGLLGGLIGGEEAQTLAPDAFNVGQASSILLPGSLGLAKGAARIAGQVGRLGVKQRVAGSARQTISQRLGGETTALGRTAIRTRQLVEGTPVIGLPFQASSAARLRQGGQDLVKFITGSEKAAARANTPTGLRTELAAGRKVLKQEFDDFGTKVGQHVDDGRANAVINDIAGQRPQFLTAKERQLLERNGAGAEDLIPIRQKLNQALAKTDDFQAQQVINENIKAIDDLIEQSLQAADPKAWAEYGVTRTKWRVQEAALRGEALTKAGTLDAQRFAANLRRSFGEDFRLSGTSERGSEQLNQFLTGAFEASDLAATQAPPFQPGLATVLGVAGGAGAGIFAGSR